MLRKLVFLSLIGMFVGCASPALQQQMLKKISEQQTLLLTQQKALEQQKISTDGIIALQQDNLLAINESQKLLARLLVIKNAESRPSTKRKVKKVVSEKDQAPVPLALEKLTLGRVEYVWLDVFQNVVKARVDTGAGYSSLHATNIRMVERDGRQWVKFELLTHKKTANLSLKGINQKVTGVYELPVERHANIKQASAEDRDQRPMVKMRIKIGAFESDTIFTLVDRSEMIYPMLLGRNFLRDLAVVDVSQRFMIPRPNAAE